MLLGGLVSTLDDIQEQRFVYRVQRRVAPVHVGNVDGAGQVNLENLFYLGFAAVVAAAMAVALIHQEFVLIKGQDFAHARTCGEFVSVFVRGLAALYVDGDDTQQVRSSSDVLEQSILHDADQSLAIGRDRESLHTLVGCAAARVVGDFVGADWFRSGNEQMIREFKAAEPHAE